MHRRQFIKTSSAASAALLQRNLFLSNPSLVPAKPRLIDAHVHVFKRDPAFPYAQGSHPPAEDASVEWLIQLMRANGVSQTVLIQVIHYRWDNSYVASALKRYPQLFQAVCRVDPEDPASPDHLSQLTQDGFRGVRLSPAAGPEGDWIRGPRMPPLWRRCADLKVPMTLLIPAIRLPDIIPLLEANPDLTVVIDHMASCPLDRPDLMLHLLNLARYPRVFVKISGLYEVSKQPYPYLDAQAHVRELAGTFGATRLIWATNWPVSEPQCSYARSVELYRDHLNFLSEADLEQILWKSASRVWNSFSLE